MVTDAVSIIDVLNTGGLISLLVLNVYVLITGKVIPEKIHTFILNREREATVAIITLILDKVSETLKEEKALKLKAEIDKALDDYKKEQGISTNTT